MNSPRTYWFFCRRRLSHLHVHYMYWDLAHVTDPIPFDKIVSQLVFWAQSTTRVYIRAFDRRSFGRWHGNTQIKHNGCSKIKKTSVATPTKEEEGTARIPLPEICFTWRKVCRRKIRFLDLYNMSLNTAFVWMSKKVRNGIRVHCSVHFICVSCLQL